MHPTQPQLPGIAPAHTRTEGTQAPRKSSKPRKHLNRPRKVVHVWRGPLGAFIPEGHRTKDEHASYHDLLSYRLQWQWPETHANDVPSMRATRIGEWPIDAYYAALRRGEVQS